MSLDLDHRLLAALEISPRVPWTRLAPVLDTDATTLARRWRVLQAERLVWTTWYPVHATPTKSPVRAAVVEIACAPGERDRVVEALAADDRVQHLVATTGERDLVAQVQGAGLVQVDRTVQASIAGCPGVSSTRTHFLPTIFVDGPSWRLRALTPEQERAVRAALPRREVPAAPGRVHRDLLAALNPDPRLPVGELASRTGHSTSTVSRALEVLAVAPWAGFRLDVAHDHLGWEAEVQLNLRVPAGSLPLVVQTLRSLPDLRMCCSTSGPANLTAVLWLRRLYELDTLEHRLLTTHPTTTVLDRWVVSRVAKRMGHLLDHDGRHLRGPAAPGWTDPA